MALAIRRRLAASLIAIAPVALAPLTMAPVVATVVAGGCMLEPSAGVRLLSKVRALNAAVRRNHLDAAVDAVRPAYRARFAASRRAWGHTVRITEADVVSILIDEQHATSRVAIRWLRDGSNRVRKTLIEQRWRLVGQDYALRDEVVAGGDADLLD